MKLKKVALLAEVIGGLGIIISIIYLALEVSENSDAQLIANHLALSGRTQSLNRSLGENRELADLIAKSRLDTSSLTPGEEEQVKFFIYSKMAIWEDALAMTLVGQLSDFYWTEWSNGICEDISEPGYADFWARDLYRFHPDDFVRVVNECLTRSGLQTATIQP
jgi:hypothetical protein